MGLNYFQFRKVVPYINGNVLSLGYPDLLLTREQLYDVTGLKSSLFTSHGDWHKFEGDIPETYHIFDKLGAKLECVDIAKVRRDEKIVDLNYPQELGSYDLVIDPGTIEHCFNVAQALMNAANAVKEGGTIYHGSPMSMVNHGFYNFNPTLFYDFYVQNGFSVEMSANIQNVKEEPLTGAHCTNRFAVIPECMLMVIAKRKRFQTLKYPTQSKYLMSPTLKPLAA